MKENVLSWDRRPPDDKYRLTVVDPEIETFKEPKQKQKIVKIFTTRIWSLRSRHLFHLPGF